MALRQAVRRPRRLARAAPPFAQHKSKGISKARAPPSAPPHRAYWKTPPFYTHGAHLTQHCFYARIRLCKIHCVCKVHFVKIRPAFFYRLLVRLFAAQKQHLLHSTVAPPPHKIAEALRFYRRKPYMLERLIGKIRKCIQCDRQGCRPNQI